MTEGSAETTVEELGFVPAPGMDIGIFKIKDVRYIPSEKHFVVRLNSVEDPDNTTFPDIKYSSEEEMQEDFKNKEFLPNLEWHFKKWGMWGTGWLP